MEYRQTSNRHSTLCILRTIMQSTQQSLGMFNRLPARAPPALAHFPVVPPVAPVDSRANIPCQDPRPVPQDPRPVPQDPRPIPQDPRPVPQDPRQVPQTPIVRPITFELYGGQPAPTMWTANQTPGAGWSRQMHRDDINDILKLLPQNASQMQLLIKCGPYPEKPSAVNIVPTGLRRSGVMRPVTRAQLLNRIAQAFETYFVDLKRESARSAQANKVPLRPDQQLMNTRIRQLEYLGSDCFRVHVDFDPYMRHME